MRPGCGPASPPSCAACSCVGHHFFQPGATVSHSWRCPALYWTGSKDGVLIVSLLCGERPNASLQLLPTARATQERRLEAVSWKALLGPARERALFSCTLPPTDGFPQRLGHCLD